MKSIKVDEALRIVAMHGEPNNLLDYFRGTGFARTGEKPLNIVFAEHVELSLERPPVANWSDRT